MVSVLYLNANLEVIFSGKTQSLIYPNKKLRSAQNSISSAYWENRKFASFEVGHRLKNIKTE
jgi:hypothetical protein